jgi:hypothetical protein
MPSIAVTPYRREVLGKYAQLFGVDLTVFPVLWRALLGDCKTYLATIVNYANDKSARRKTNPDMPTAAAGTETEFSSIQLSADDNADLSKSIPATREQLDAVRELLKRARGLDLPADVTEASLDRDLDIALTVSAAVRARFQKRQPAAEPQSGVMQFAISEEAQRQRNECEISEQPFAPGNISPGLAKKIVDVQAAEGNLGATTKPPKKN